MKKLEELIGIEFPVIMAPMFLVSNVPMLKAGIDSGIMSVFPSLNFRKPGELTSVLRELRDYTHTHTRGGFGVNLIVQKSNPFYQEHLEICLSEKVQFYITSLGNPGEVIRKAHANGAKVFCDVTNLPHAEKCASLGCDGFIAVGQGAGGHAGPNPLQVLVPALRKKFPSIPVVAAGGIATGAALLSVMVLGASGASIGTRFIASVECAVTDAYKQAIIDAGMDDIVMTSKLSGSPCTIINTSEAKKIGYDQNWFERYMSRNPTTRKWFKMLLQSRGMKKLEQSVLPNNYTRLWCAGKVSELVDDILSCEEIVQNIKREYQTSLGQIKS